MGVVEFFPKDNILYHWRRNAPVVIPVNCQGVMGAGLAGQFRDIAPEGYLAYRNLCDGGVMRIGHPVSSKIGTKSVVFFPTMNRPGQRARLEHIAEGLDRLAARYRDGDDGQHVTLLIPRLGCGIGRLDWKDVHDLILERFHDAPNCSLKLFGHDLRDRE